MYKSRLINLTDYVPRPISKFCRISKNSLNNLKNNQIYFANPMSFNDPFDCNYFIDLDFKVNDVNNFKYFLRTYYDMTLDDYRKEQNEKLKQISKRFGISCFSKSYKNIVLWSHYAESHTGFCLVFDSAIEPDFFYSEQSLPMVLISEVNYENPTYKPTIKLKGRALALYYMYTKSGYWKYEEEVRMISPSSGSISFNKYALKKIIFGCRCSEADRDSLTKIISEANYPDVEFWEAKQSKIKFSLTFTKLN